MKANILPLHTLSTPGWGLKVKHFFSSNKSNEQEGWACTYHGHLYHGWVGGCGDSFNPVGDSCIAYRYDDKYHSNRPQA